MEKPVASNRRSPIRLQLFALDSSLAVAQKTVPIRDDWADRKYTQNPIVATIVKTMATA